MTPDIAGARGRTRPASASTGSGHQPCDEHPGRQDQDSLLAAATALASASGTARHGGMDTRAALAAITAARSLAAELEHGELAFIDAARSGGATWTQIAAAMGARNRQTAQKRHADLERRRTRPPSVDTRAAPQQETANGSRPVSATAPGPGNSPPARAGRPAREHRNDQPVPSPATANDSGPTARPVRSQPEQPQPEITDVIIREGRYELARAPGHHETRSWHVTVSGTRVGTVRPTWRGERTRPGWEAADNTGLALPATATGRTTAAGNARTRDAAAVSLLHALQRQQQDERKTKRKRR